MRRVHIVPPWLPRNRKAALRNARLHRLMRNGILKPMSGAERTALLANLDRTTGKRSD
jgi:hypothetical protein